MAGTESALSWRRPSRLSRALRRRVQGDSLVDEHDGDVVLDPVEKTAVMTDEAVFLVVEDDVALAPGARQDVQEFFPDRHRFHPPFVSDVKRESVFFTVFPGNLPFAESLTASSTS